MSKIQQIIAISDKYSSDMVMSRLLECGHDIECINDNIKSYGSDNLTLEEIGLVLGVTRERVRQIEASALRKLRSPKVGRLLREYVMM